jgi:hypothetical protein
VILKLTLFLFLFASALNVFAISRPVRFTDSANSLTVSQLLSLSPGEFSKLTGKKMNLIERFIFRMQQKRMARKLNKASHGAFNIQDRLVDLLWYVLGFFIIGVPLAYITKQNRRHKWAAWSGLITLVGGFLLIILLGWLLSSLFSCEDCK